MAVNRRGNEAYTAENIAAFVDEFARTGDAATAYAGVFKTRGVDYNTQAGTVLCGRADVAALIREKQAAVLAAARQAAGLGELATGAGEEFTIRERMAIARRIIRDETTPAQTRAQLLVKYEQLEEQAAREALGEEKPIADELAAFLGELRSAGA